MYCAELNDIHGCVIKTKPTECFRGSGGYKRSQVGLIPSLLILFCLIEIFGRLTALLQSLHK